MVQELHPALTATGRFQVKNCLGSGGFGVVFEVFDAEVNARVALKWLRSSDTSTLARFKREFRSLADLAHPNLVGFRELITVAGEWFFTMDLVEGSDLLRYVRPPGGHISGGYAQVLFPSAPPPAPAAPLQDSLDESTVRVNPTPFAPPTPRPPGAAPRREVSLEMHRPLCAADLRRVRGTLEQLANGLEALHAAGLIHRDVKPSNVLVTKDGRVVILDLGLVTEMGDDGLALTMTGNVVGTPAYMSPEQARGAPATAASDWYSVGVILYQALTGRIPFDTNPNAFLLRKQLEEAVSPTEIVRGVPKGLADLCTDLLSRQPERRPSGAEFLERLRQALPLERSPDSASFAVAPRRSPIPSVAPSRNTAPIFVGRETHILALEQSLDEAERGKAVMSFVDGSSGMGKSALVRHFLDRVKQERPETLILEGRCYERESMPYKAVDSLVDSLCRYLQRLPEVEIAKLLPRDLASLTRLFPVFLELEGPERRRSRRGRIEPVEERRRAFEALRELLARIADRSSVILFIDDLQWGDVDSEPLLTALFRAPDPPPLLLIASYRSEDAAAAPLVSALRAIAAASTAHVEAFEIPVAELSPEAASELAQGLLAGRGGPALAEALAVESCGSPLFLRQLASLRHTAQSIDLATALRQRVDALEPEARRLLETLAVSGRPLALAAAARAAGVDEDLQGVVARLRGETLVRTRGGNERERHTEIEVYHDRIREVVVASVAGEHLKGIHAKLAEALSGEGNADAETLAAHYAAAGDTKRAAELAEKAADRAARALAFTRAAEMYERALELDAPRSGPDGAVSAHTSASVSSGPTSRPTPVPSAGATSSGSIAVVASISGDSPGGGHLLVKLAEALVNAGRGRDAARRFLEAVPLASAADGLELRRRAAEQLLFSGHIDEGLRVMDAILVAMKMRAPKSRLGVVFDLMWHRFLLAVRGHRFGERTVDAIPRAELVRIDTCFSLGFGLLMVDPIRGAAFQARYLLLALAAGEPFRIAKGFALEAAYRSDAAKNRKRVDRLLALARALADRLGQPYLGALIALVDGISRLLLGEPARALAILGEAETALRDKCTGVTWERDNAAFFTGTALLHSGCVAELALKLGPQIEDARSRGDLYGETLLRLQCSWIVKLVAGNIDGARADLAAIPEEWTEGRFLLQNVWQTVNRIDVELYAGRVADAWTLISDAWPRIEQSRLLRPVMTRVRTIDARARAAIAAAWKMRDVDERRSLVEEAAKIAKTLAREPWPRASAYAFLIDAAVAAIHGDKAKTIFELQRAVARFEIVDADETKGLAAENGKSRISHSLYLLSARFRLGQLLGGPEGAAAVESATKAFIAQGVTEPLKMARVYVPFAGIAGTKMVAERHATPTA